MSITELQEFFTNYPPQKEIQLNQSAKINDSATFIKTCMIRIECWKGDINNCPSYWHLKELYEVAKNSMIKKEAF